jgi:hypothetical protein
MYTDTVHNYINIVGLNALTKYSEIKNKITNFTNYVYTYHPIITCTIDISVYSYKWLYAMHYNENIEPYHNYWVSTNYLMQHSFQHDAPVTNMDNYNYVYDNNTKSYPYTFIHNINTCCNLLTNTSFNSLYKENLLYAKYNNIYISRVHHKCGLINHFKSITEFNIPSSVCLLSVTLKVNDKTINMDVDKNHMYVNNELFSRGFVTRYIKYNNIDINYNDDYIIHIMDMDINMVELKSNQYLVINKSDYVVKTINKDE